MSLELIYKYNFLSKYSRINLKKETKETKRLKWKMYYLYIHKQKLNLRTIFFLLSNYKVADLGI